MDAAFDQLSEDVADLWSSSSSSSSSIPQIDASELTALRFFREFVSQSKPLIINGLVDHWAVDHWADDEYICDASNDPEVSVNVTPNGWGDCIHKIRGGEDVFVRPEERTMKLSEFLSILDGVDSEHFDGAAYISHQNDSLRTQFSALMKDVDDVLPLAREAFDSMPDASNLWLGNEKSVSSLHKDHYENMYVVVHGVKHFLLFPPADVAFLENGVDDQNFRTSRFIYCRSDPQNETDRNDETEDGFHDHEFENAIPLEDNSSSPSWKVLMDDDGEGGCVTTTPWVRPWDESTGPPPRTSPIEVVVRKGQVLYLPALWYHQVSQRGRTIAVNYWHDMVFDHKWIYHNFVRNAAKAFREQQDEDGGKND